MHNTEWKNHIRLGSAQPSNISRMGSCTGFHHVFLGQDKRDKRDKSDIFSWLVVDLPLWNILANGKDYPIYEMDKNETTNQFLCLCWLTLTDVYSPVGTAPRCPQQAE